MSKESLQDHCFKVRTVGHKLRAWRVRKFISLSMTLIATVLAIQISAFCQINTATLSGSVKDSAGAAIPGASVVVVQTATGISRTAATNESGFFNVPLLQPGDYNVSVSKEGFNTDTEKIQLHVNQSANLDFSLVVGSVQQTVNVTSATPDLQTQTAGLGTVIGTDRN